MDILRKETISVEFWANHPKLYRNCVIPQNCHTRKLGKITVFYTAVIRTLPNISDKTFLENSYKCLTFKVQNHKLFFLSAHFNLVFQNVYLFHILSKLLLALSEIIHITKERNFHSLVTCYFLQITRFPLLVALLISKIDCYLFPNTFFTR